MKRWIAMGLCALMMFGGAACSGNNNSNTGGNDEPPTPPTDNTEYQDVVVSPKCPEIDDSDYTVYYFDAVGGNDSNDGLSEAKAKQSVSAISSIASSATEKTKILLKAGTTFSGNISISGYTSSADYPLIIDKYGNEDEYPLISGANGTAFDVNGDNIRIYNLEVTNPKGSKGISVQAAKDGENTGVVIEGCYIHDIGWNWTKEKSVEEVADDIANYVNVEDVCPTGSYVYATTGIYMGTPNPNNSTTARWYTDCYITNNKITRTGRCGIFCENGWITGNGCYWGGKNKFYSLDNGWYPYKNLVVSKNEVTYVGGDGILVIGAQDTYIEYNTCLHAGLLGRAGYAIAGIWFINARRVYMQFNEAGYTHLENGCTDGEGLDLDIGCSDSIVQYNYSHDNDGGGLLICNAHSMIPEWDENGNPVIDPETGKQNEIESVGYWNNNIIRNNVFACNGRNSFITASSDCKNIICENNTIILSPEITSQTLITCADYVNCGMQENFILRNNVFYAKTNQYTSIVMDYCESYIFENNLYYNFPDSFFDKWTGIEDSKAIRNVDPGIEIPEDRTGYDKINLFRPTNTEVFSLGMRLQNLSVKDILGNNTRGKKYVGAYCE